MSTFGQGSDVIVVLMRDGAWIRLMASSWVFLSSFARNQASTIVLFVVWRYSAAAEDWLGGLFTHTETVA